MRTLLGFVGFAFIASLSVLAGCAPAADEPTGYDPASDDLRFPGEIHFRNIKQLTYGGNNAEAYWTRDDQQLVFQSDHEGLHDKGCDHIFLMNADGSPLEDGEQYRMISNGEGRTTCAFDLQDGRIVFASTHEGGVECPTVEMSASGRYVWPIFDTYDIYAADKNGENLELLIGGDGYDAEATVSPDGRYVIFTSTRSGDLELWRYDMQTAELLQLTDGLGYDGGAFFSPDGSQIVWRADRPEGEDAAVYQELLAQGLVQPGELNIFVADADGSNARQVTELPGANWAPFFTPDGQSIVFSSNHHTMDQGGRVFDIFHISAQGGEITQLTHSGTFDAFPMFSYDGTKIAFASNRVADGEPTRDTNIFVADWVAEPEEVDLTFGQGE